MSRATPPPGRTPHQPPARNVAVRITPDAVRQVRGGSPWVFDGSIDSVTFDAEPGTIAVLFDRKREFVGVGLYDPHSPIRVRVLHHGERVQIDDEFFRTRIAAAIARRDRIRDGLDSNDGPITTGYRLVNGENDGMPGLIADRYGDVVVIKWYTVAWAPYLDTLLTAFIDATGARTVVLRLARAVADAAGRIDVADRPLSDGITVYGPEPTEPVIFRENELWFEADVVHGQKTGHFLDQRDNRARLKNLAAESDVLDVFASTGGFSVAAVAGGARSVTLIDQSAPALAAARRNLERNEGSTPGHPRPGATQSALIVADAFAELERLGSDGALFDIVVVDPPSFAQNQASVAGALAAYQRLTTLALAVLNPGGILVQCSCSSRITSERFFEAVFEAAERSGRPLGEIERTFHPLDHPIGFEFGAYLKALFAYAP